VQSFRDIMDSRQAKQLEDWIKKAEICGIQELKGFVLGIRRDFDAVYASLSLEWSNGLVEGHIHRLKLIKSQMYGRANFDLLRNRVLYQE
jgi:transposase